MKEEIKTPEEIEPKDEMIDNLSDGEFKNTGNWCN